MKHIKKRFFLESQKGIPSVKGKVFNVLDVDQNDPLSKLPNKKNIVAFIQTDLGYTIGGLIQKVSGKNYVIPVPDPTLVYFNTAQMFLREIDSHKKKMLSKLDITNKEMKSEPALVEIYNFFGATTGFVTSLFTSLESFLNQQIPEEYVYTKSNNRSTELYSKQQIQEYLDFKTKITVVLREVTGQDFFRNTTKATQDLWNLKEFRDAIVHTKQEQNPLRYEALIKSSLTFDYKRTLDSIVKFMNHYSPDYIVECDCGKDF